MAGSASISGLASGLDTAGIISQLMQLEAVPQSRLKTQVSTQESQVKSLQELNTKVAALTKKAQELAKATGWSPVTATSSYDKVTVSTGAGAMATSFSFTVGQRAAAHSLTFTDSAALNAVVVSGGTSIRIDKLDGTTVDVDTGDGTLGGLVAAINASGEGLRATTIKLDDGTYRLKVESATTGAASDFTLTNLDGSDLLSGSSVVTGQDAAITVGADTIHSASNTFADLLPGVSITLGYGAAAGTAVDIDLATDAGTMSTTVKGLVDQLNEVLTQIDTLTKAGSKGVKAGPLAGDSTLRQLRDNLLGSIYSTAGGSLADLGLQTDRYGAVTFDETTFKAAYEADPVATAARFTKATTDTGFADRLAVVADQASAAYTGSLSTSITSRKTNIDRLNDSIDQWDRRLELRRSTLTRQFTALETALSSMQSQSNWLAGQIASLPSSY